MSGLGIYQGNETIKQVFQEDKFEENVQDELGNLEAWQQLEGYEINQAVTAVLCELISVQIDTQLHLSDRFLGEFRRDAVHIDQFGDQAEMW